MKEKKEKAVKQKRERKQGKHLNSLKSSLILLVLVCWILPLIIVGVISVSFITHNVNQQVADTVNGTARFSAQMSVERMDSVVESSREASYNGSIGNAYRNYLIDQDYSELYQRINSFLTQQYRFDERFIFTLLSFYDDNHIDQLSGIDFYTYQDSSFVDADKNIVSAYGVLREYRENDKEIIMDKAAKLGTNVGFVQRGENIYMVRNIYVSVGSPVAALVMRLNIPSLFDSMANVPWGTDITVWLNQEPVTLKGESASFSLLNELGEGQNASCYSKQNGQSYVLGRSRGDGYTLSYSAKINSAQLLGNLDSFRYSLIALFILMVPMLFIVVRYFYSNISRPIGKLVEGANQIEEGNFGVQVLHRSSNKEFAILTDAFNEMSSRLKYQFDKIYMEEIALRDARIMALQSQINPHFLNNTLEIINWEARLADDVKVARMIEALSTMLDAAMDRKGDPVVHLSQEMMYVDSYLYIISERLGKRLTVTKEIDQSLLDIKVPRLIVQPIIENAVEHGIEPMQRGEICIRIYKADAVLALEIENNGAMTLEDEARITKLLSDDYDASKEGAGNLGIRNVNQRLRIIYGEKSSLTIKMTSEGHALARIVIPIDQFEQ